MNDFERPKKPHNRYNDDYLTYDFSSSTKQKNLDSNELVSLQQLKLERIKERKKKLEAR